MFIKWVKNNILDLIQSVGMVVALVVTAIAWLIQNVPWYLALLGLLFAVVLILVGINQYEIRKERHKKRLVQLSDKEVESTIRDWVDKPSFLFQRSEHMQGRLFQFTITYKDIPVSITRLKANPNVLFLAVNIVPAEEHKPKLDSLQEPRRSDLIFNLRVEMARLGVGFVGIKWPIENMQIQDFVTLDSLTEFHLLNHIMLVIRAKVLISELVSQELKETINIVGSVPDKGDSQT